MISQDVGEVCESASKERGRWTWDIPTGWPYLDVHPIYFNCFTMACLWNPGLFDDHPLRMIIDSALKSACTLCE